jgi:hypothetical protein
MLHKQRIFNNFLDLFAHILYAADISTRSNNMLAITPDTRQAIVNTWYSIAGDAYDACEGDNEIAVELVLDADRLAFAGYAEANQEIRQLCKQYGFGVVRAALSKHIQLL